MARRCRARKCQPGVFCIENTTLLFLIIIIGVFLYVTTQSVYKISLTDEKKKNISFRTSFQRQISL